MQDDNFWTANLNGQGDPGEATREKGVIYATKGELGARGGKLKSENRRSHYALRDKSLEWRACMKDGYGLEGHTHQAVWCEFIALKSHRVTGCKSECLIISLWCDGSEMMLYGTRETWGLQ